MAMGTRKDREEQEELWVPHTALPKGASHPFYQRLNQLLEESHFDEFVEGRCQRFYAKKRGRPSLVPGVYFRLLLIGYFEGIDSERGMAWRANDSLALRRFLRSGGDGAGRGRSENKQRCTPTGVGSGANVGSGYCGNAARSWNEALRTCMKRAGCGACICGGTRTS